MEVRYEAPAVIEPGALAKMINSFGRPLEAADVANLGFHTVPGPDGTPVIPLAHAPQSPAAVTRDS